MSNSLVHVLVQRLTRSSQTQTFDRDCFSPLLMRLDDREIASCSYASSDDLSDCAGHSAAVSSQRSSAIEER